MHCLYSFNLTLTSGAQCTKTLRNVLHISLIDTLFNRTVQMAGSEGISRDIFLARAQRVKESFHSSQNVLMYEHLKTQVKKAKKEKKNTNKHCEKKMLRYEIHHVIHYL